MEKKIPLLLVEDDNRLAPMIKEYLDKNGFDVTWERRGDCAEKRLAECSPKVVVLDIMLPGLDGFSICRAIRPTFTGPILMLTAKGDDIDHVVGLELGADDYVAKPMTPRVLLARLTALLRRTQAEAEPRHATDTFTFGSLVIDTRDRNAFLSGTPLSLTTNEFNLLTLLASRAGEVVSRDDISTTIRGVAYDGQDRSVDVLVSRVRKKVGDDPKRPKRIKTVWAAGYLLVTTAWDDPS